MPVATPMVAMEALAGGVDQTPEVPATVAVDPSLKVARMLN